MPEAHRTPRRLALPLSLPPTLFPSSFLSFFLSSTFLFLSFLSLILKLGLVGLSSVLKVSGCMAVLNFLIFIQELGELRVGKNVLLYSETFHSTINTDIRLREGK